MAVRPSDPTLAPFARFVTETRERRGWSKMRLARELGVDHALPVHWEKARVAPTDTPLIRIAQIAGVPVADVAALIPRYRNPGELRLARWAGYETRPQFAARIGLPESTLVGWERGGTVDIERLAAAGIVITAPEATKGQLVTPVPYMGSKASRLDRILPLIPTATTFVEPFGGSGTVLFARPPARIEVYNDIDRRLVALFSVLRDPGRAAQLKVRLERTLYSRAEHQTAVRFLKARGGTEDDVAWAMFVLLGQSRYGLGLEFESNWAAPHRRTSVSGWWKRVAWVDHWHERLAQVAIECDDAVAVIRRYDSADTAFYIDPPYTPSTTTRFQVYKHPYRSGDHRLLVDALLDTKGAVVLAGYRNDEYRRLEKARWRLVPIGGKEHVWCSPGRRRKRVAA